MSHLGQEALRRILGGEGASREAEQVAEHLVACDRCRSLAGSLLEELRAERPGLQGQGSLQLVFDLIDQERQWGVESLAAMAEWAEVRKLPGRRSQRERVRMTKACHTLAFVKLVLGELKEESSWDQAEFLAGLALLAIEGMSQRQLISLAAGHDLQAEIWTAVANARRRAAEWSRAQKALDNAERLLRRGPEIRIWKRGSCRSPRRLWQTRDKSPEHWKLSKDPRRFTKASPSGLSLPAPLSNWRTSWNPPNPPRVWRYSTAQFL